MLGKPAQTGVLLFTPKHLNESQSRFAPSSSAHLPRQSVASTMTLKPRISQRPSMLPGASLRSKRYEKTNTPRASVKSESEESDSLGKLDSDRYRMLLCIMLAFFAIHTTNMNVETIIPTHVSHKHKTINQTQVSFIIM